jgi:gas vesicle protein
MEEKESALTKAVRETVVNAVESGEDITEKLSEITLDVAKKAYEWVKDISDGTNPVGVETADLMEQTTEQALNSMKETGDKAVEMAKEVVKGVLGAVKELLEENKT